MASTPLRAAIPVFGTMFITIVGGGIFALPIALAPLGPRNAVMIVILGGLFNMVTIAAVAVGLARTSATTGAAGRLATITAQRFGGRLGLITAIVMGLMMFGLATVCVLGVSGSLVTVHGGSQPAYALGLLAIVALVVVLQPRRLLTQAATIATIVSIGLLVALMVMLVPHVDADILRAPPLPEFGLRESLLAAFGTVLYAYFAHATVPSVAPQSLRADPSGRALLWGCLAAMGLGTVVHSTWTLLTLGSVPAAAYADQGSTGVGVLGAVLGDTGQTIALVDIILALGMGALIYGIILGDIATERLPTFRRLTLDVRPGLVIEASDGPPDPAQCAMTIALAPDGSGLVARARRGTRAAHGPVTPGAWSADSLAAEVGGARPRRWLRLVSVSAPDGTVRVELASTMTVIVHEPATAGAAALIDPDEDVARVVRELTRAPDTWAGLAQRLEWDEAHLRGVIDRAVVQGSVLERDGVVTANLGHRHPSRQPVTRALAEQYADAHESAPLPTRAPSWLASPLAARIAAPMPLLVVLAVLLYLFAAGTSFTTVISLIGIGTVVLVAVTLPLLLAISTVRNRDTMGPRTRWVPAQPVLWALLLAVTGVVGLYGLLIYQVPLERAVALASFVVSVYAIVVAIRRRITHRVAVLVIDIDDSRGVRVRCIDAGRPIAVRAPAHLPVTGQPLEVLIPGEISRRLHLVARAGDAPAPELTWFRVSWPGGTQTVDAVPDLAGMEFDLGGPAHPVRVECGVV